MSSISGAQALQSFLAEKDVSSKTRPSRLYIKGNELRYGTDLGCMTLFAAKLGFGRAAMSNVSSFIKTNKDTYFADDIAIADYNTFISAYNDKQCICWKKAKKVKIVAVQIFQPDTTTTGATGETGTTGAKGPTPFDYSSKEEMHKLVKHHLSNGLKLLNDPDLDETFTALNETCQLLNLSLQTWELDEEITPEEKQTINEILNFKNAVRNTVFPAKDKPLKGAACVYNPLKNINQTDKDNLKATLKEIRTDVLKKYFQNRLEADKNKLVQLRFQFEATKNNLSEIQFLGEQLDRWEAKNAAGKPISIPKWYHCTKTADVIDKIIDTDVLYKHDGMYPGVFVANLPEHGYGTYCLMMSDHIEKTGIKDPDIKPKDPTKKADPVYPNFSNMTQPSAIKYSDTPVASQSEAFKNNQDGLGIWFGFQRGAKSGGKAGIPIQKTKRIQDGALRYYRDTTLGFIYAADNNFYYSHQNKTSTKDFEKIGLKYRVQVLNQKEAEALRSLINATFFCTLPANWDGKLQRC